MTRKLGGLALLLAALGAAATPATAQTTSPPKPVPCDGVLSITDPAGDAFVGFAGTSSPVAAEANQDVKGLFFRTEGTKVFAHLVVKDLTATIPPGAMGIVYRLIYTTEDGIRRFVDFTFAGDVYQQALGSAPEEASYGTLTGGLTVEGSTPFKLWKGADGVIQVQVPSLKPGREITGITWNAATDRGAVIAQSDITPVADYDGAACPKPTA